MMLAVGCSRQAYIRVKPMGASTGGQQITRGGTKRCTAVGVGAEWIGEGLRRFIKSLSRTALVLPLAEVLMVALR
jgi:hypothetical protein